MAQTLKKVAVPIPIAVTIPIPTPPQILNQILQAKKPILISRKHIELFLRPNLLKILKHAMDLVASSPLQWLRMEIKKQFKNSFSKSIKLGKYLLKLPQILIKAINNLASSNVPQKSREFEKFNRNLPKK